MVLIHTDKHECLGATQSVCPVCLEKIPAGYYARQDGVWLEKSCPHHGGFAVPVWDNQESFERWQRHNPPQKPTNPAQPVQQGCPYDCGLCLQHIQATCCVLLEITSRCNLQCPICFAGSGGEIAVDDPALTTISGWYDMLLRHGGPFNIQLSGGEPSLRDDLAQIIRMGREKGFRFFQLNTNGLRLANQRGFAKELAAAGLNTVFLQFDTLCPEKSIALRGKDVVEIKKQAVNECVAAGLGVVLVPTVVPGVNDDELGAIMNYAAEHMPGVRGVHFQPVSYFGRYGECPRPQDRLTIPLLLEKLEEQTGGKLKADDFLPGGAEHALCSFHADYHVSSGSWSCVTSEKTGCCCASETPCSSNSAREAVALKWSAPQELPQISLSGGSRYDFSALDDFLVQKNQYTMAVSGMAFQDAWTLDLNRLQRCYIHVVSPQNTLVPFCAYNLTSVAGDGLYRGR